MKKVVIVGEMNQLMMNMNQILSEEFLVQICAPDAAFMTDMIRIVAPDLVILCLIGVYDVRKDLFEAAAGAGSNVPVLTLERDQTNEAYEKYYETEQFEALICPVKKSVLIEKCCERAGEGTTIPQDLGQTEYILDEETEHRKKHILVVDDSPLLLRNIKSMLEPAYKISVANSGEQALRFVPKRKPDLILLDYEMPDMDGRETFEKLKEDEVGRNIPVVFLTGVADKQHIYAALHLEPAGYILKPPSLDKLLSVVEDALYFSGK